MPRKAAGKAVKGRPFAQGADARRNIAKAGPGRPPVAFAQACADLQRGVILDRCRAVLTDRRKGPGSKDWEWAAEWVSRYGEREVAKQVHLSGGMAALGPPMSVDEWSNIAAMQQALLTQYGRQASDELVGRRKA